MALTLNRFLNLVYTFITMNMEPKDKASFDMKLYAPPPGAARNRVDAASPWAPQNETSALRGLAAAIGGG